MDLLVDNLLAGLSITIRLAVLSFVLITVIGVICATLSLWGGRLSKLCVVVYVEFFRGTSVFVQIFAIYFALPSIGISFEPFTAGLVALSLNGGAYATEIIRGALASVPQHQWEACKSLNLSFFDSLRYIVFPQATVVAIPSMANEAIATLKNTSLVSLISVSELTFAAFSLRLTLGSNAIPMVSVLIVYYGLSRFIDLVFRWAYSRVRYEV